MARKATPKKQQHATAALQVPAGRPLRLVVVADTHSRPHPDSHRHIASQSPDAILHAGDIGSLDVIDGLAELAPTLAVRGNIDGVAETTPDSIDIDVLTGDQRLLRLFMLHIAVVGPKLRADVARTAHAHDADVVVCGHSHVPFIGRDRDLYVFNPGSIGPRRFHLPITFGVIEVGAGTFRMRHVSCETGEVWAP